MTTTTAKPTRSARVGIIGTGFAGLGMAIRLRQTGLDDFLLLERGDRIGGTWRDNDYPGCACDVPSNLYSYSFAPNPDWTTTFAHQPEILAYTNKIVADHDLLRSTRLNTMVLDARWDTETQLWNVDTNDGAYTFEVLVSATGPLSAPSIPDLPGLIGLRRPGLPLAEWDHSVDLNGKRVAVIAPAPRRSSSCPSCRRSSANSSSSSAPRRGYSRPEYKTSRLRRALFKRFPVLQRIGRQFLYWGHESYVIGFTASRP